MVIGLKTVKGSKQLKLDPTIYDSLSKEKVQVWKGVGMGLRESALLCKEFGAWQQHTGCGCAIPSGTPPSSLPL